MKKFPIFLKVLFFSASQLFAEPVPRVHYETLGQSMGGWVEKGGRAALFENSGSRYRSWKPEVSPTPTGGIFVSVRIDHLRGILASDDHASLEVTFGANGDVVSARSSIALQGRRVTSDLVEGTGRVGAQLVGMELAAKVGTEMISNLSAKILREKVKEPGRVSFPAVLQHQYNLLCLAVVMEDKAAGAETVAEGEERPEREEKTAVPLSIDPPQK